jgi:hypothetical protein
MKIERYEIQTAAVPNDPPSDSLNPQRVPETPRQNARQNALETV